MSEPPAPVNDRPLIRTDVQFTNPPDSTTDAPAAIVIREANLFYGTKQALYDISMDIAAKHVTAFIGPSGCGKSTLLRCLNRMNDLIDNVRITGTFDVQGSSTRHHRRHRSPPPQAWCFRNQPAARSTKTSSTASDRWDPPQSGADVRASAAQGGRGRGQGPAARAARVGAAQHSASPARSDRA